MHIIRSLLVVLCFLGMTNVGFAAQATTEHHAKATSEQQDTTVKAKKGEPVNINTADAKKLTTLKGIGMKRAEAIVAYRKQHGEFKTVNDLTKVRGMSEKLIKKNEGMIRLNDK